MYNNFNNNNSEAMPYTVYIFFLLAVLRLLSWGTYFSMEGDHFLLPNLVREGDHNLLGGTVFGSQFWSRGLILAATFGPGGPLLGGTEFRVTRPKYSSLIHRTEVPN